MQAKTELKTMKSSIKSNLLIIGVLTLALGVCLPTQAQDLHTTLEVESEVEPLELDAQPLEVSPVLQLPAITLPSLKYSDKIVTTLVPLKAANLDPAPYPVLTSGSRGYVLAGFFPRYNAFLKAKYKILDNNKTQLTASGNYQGHVYKRDFEIPEAEPQNLFWRDQKVNLSLSLTQQVGTNSRFLASTSWLYGANTIREYGIAPHETLQGLKGGLKLGYASNLRDVNYLVEAGYNRFAYQNYWGQNQYSISVKARKNELSGQVKADFLNDGHTGGVITLHPAYSKLAEKYTLSLGVNASVLINQNSTFNIAPAVTAALTPSPFFAIGVKATGGVLTNSYTELFKNLPWMRPQQELPMTRIPIYAEAAATFGPFKGAYLRISGAYARANDWLTPLNNAYYGSVDLRSFLVGVELGANIQDILTLKAKYSTTPGDDFTHGWYQWQDRARHVAEFSAQVTPLKLWSIKADYRFRFDRTVYSAENFEPESLGTVAGLDITVNYKVMPQLTLFAQALNLLTRQAYDPGLHPRQGTSALIGGKIEF